MPTPEHDSLLGHVVGAVYRLDRVLGRGGMGVVYAATQMDTGKCFAVKVISREHGADSIIRRRFAREAVNGLRINHPNAVRTLQVGEAEGMAWMVMEFAEGRTLHTLVSEEGRCEPSVAVAWVTQLADVLEAVHRLGIVHRDVKPGNIMVQGRGHAATVRLLDFGLSRDSFDADHVITLKGNAVGTPGFMAPEQRAGHSADSAADVFSLAGVAAFMLAGRMPVAAWALPLKTSMFGKVRRWPEDVDQVLNNALAPDPAQRTSSPRQFARELATAANAPGWSQSVLTLRFKPPGGASPSANESSD